MALRAGIFADARLLDKSGTYSPTDQLSVQSPGIGRPLAIVPGERCGRRKRRAGAVKAIKRIATTA